MNRIQRYGSVAGDFVGRYQLAIMFVGVVVLLGYCAGKSSGASDARTHVADSVRQVLADSSHAIEVRLTARQAALDFAQQASEAARAIHQPARAKIRVISDTVLSVVRETDTVRVEVPREVVREIQASDTRHAADSVRIDLLTLQVRDLSTDRDTWQRRALLDEDVLKRSRPSRFGFRAGAIVGAVSIVALASLIR